MKPTLIHPEAHRRVTDLTRQIDRLLRASALSIGDDDHETAISQLHCVIITQSIATEVDATAARDALAALAAAAQELIDTIYVQDFMSTGTYKGFAIEDHKLAETHAENQQV
jgi:hypothetical protein